MRSTFQLRSEEPVVPSCYLSYEAHETKKKVVKEFPVCNYYHVMMLEFRGSTRRLFTKNRHPPLLNRAAGSHKPEEDGLGQTRANANSL